MKKDRRNIHIRQDCGEKIKFPGEGSAKRYVVDHGLKDVRIYPCRCGNHHITTSGSRADRLAQNDPRRYQRRSKTRYE